MNIIINGRVIVLGSNVDTDQIFPGRYLELVEPAEIGRHCLEGVDPQISKTFRHGDIVAAGANFGCGSSREHAPIALINMGASLVIAESFARIFFRNAINLGLPLIICENITKALQNGDQIEVNLEAATIFHCRTGRLLQGLQLGDHALGILRVGGIKAIMRAKKESMERIGLMSKMNYMGINIGIKNRPGLDPGYIPAYGFIDGYLSGAKKPYAIAWEREGGYIAKYDTFIYGAPEHAELDLRYIEFIVKFAFYAWGGWKLYLCGDDALSEKLKETCLSAVRFKKLLDVVQKAYERPLAFEIIPYEQCPSANDGSKSVGRHLDGYRIGFDAGGSDYKVSAVADGEAIYSEETEWNPKLQSDPDYHYERIVKAMRTAASKMPGVDAIGVSTAGIVVDNHVMGSTLFQLVPADMFEQKAKNIYLRAAKEIGDIPVAVQNDGDVSALAGSMSIGENRVLGIAMGTSEAAGYVDAKGNLTGWLNELALAPVDLNEEAPFDATAQDVGVGASYFSQDSVIRLAAAAGIELDEELLPAQKLKVVQALMAQNDSRARQIYEDIGCCFAHTLALYSLFYDIRHVLLLGRVTSGLGGDIMLAECKRVMLEEYPKLSDEIFILLPDEKARRVGQSVAAASLPKITS